MMELGAEIKKRIKSDIGDALTVSIGIGPNRFLAKTGANLTKPDGLDTIDVDTYDTVFKKLVLTDLTGIKEKNAARLNSLGIFTVWDFYEAPIWKLKAAFESINGYYWHMRLHGYEIDRVEFGRRSYGNSYALPKPFETVSDLSPLLSKLVTKMSARVRKAGLAARGIHVAIWYRDGGVYHRGFKTQRDLRSTASFYEAALVILKESPQKPVRNLAVSSFNLRPFSPIQGELFVDTDRILSLTAACDQVNTRYGTYTITPARVLPAKQNIPDRIAFGNVKELEELMQN
jgi:DNA polymerase-4